MDIRLVLDNDLTVLYFAIQDAEKYLDEIKAEIEHDKNSPNFYRALFASIHN